MLSLRAHRPRTAPLFSVAILFSALLLWKPIVVQSSATAVQHSIGSVRKGLSYNAATPEMSSPQDGPSSAKNRASNWLIGKRFNHSPVRSRSLVHSKVDQIKGRKVLFSSRGCASQDLTLTQGAVSSTSGIPTFSVQIINLCGNCAMGSIHVACGNWASATPVDPYVFSRLGYNDCLVNNGKPLSSQGTISFQYSNSAMYPMSITSASNECPP